MIKQTPKNWCFSEYELTHLKVFGGHHTDTLPRYLGDHHRDAVLDVAGPVLLLTLWPTEGDGVTSLANFALPLLLRFFVALVTR